MKLSWLLLSLIVLMSAPRAKPASDSSCIHNDEEFFKLIEGESFYFEIEDPNLPDENITWYKDGPEIQNITTEETHRIHYHGGALLFLNISAIDSGNYAAREMTPSDKCVYHHVKIEVYSKNSREKVTYGSIKNSDQNKLIECPDPVDYICMKFNGNFTWLKGNNLLPGHHENKLWIENAGKKDEDIYTCVCTWIHNHKMYKTSGSRKLIVLDRPVYRDVEIISPTSKEQLANKGISIKLNCTVYCGINAQRECKASWYINNEQVNQMDGYSETTKLEIKYPSNNTFYTAILTIKQVSAEDFKHKFMCKGSGFYSANNTTVTLKQRESCIPLIITGICVFFIGVSAAAVVKYFAIDLALLFRPCLSPSRGNNVSDQTDRLKMVESYIEQSRRLIVILTPKSGSEVIKNPASDQTLVIGGFDWQVGLHHALVQREISVILIQLGETGPQGYRHLPPGLQHLIRKSAPIRWPEGSRKALKWNSHFWKRVRYMMPARPAKKMGLSAVI
ncbi:PREDICTED: interleukin-1 receptor-like 1 [Cyprinodon variegatus]|uniref:interleukin-1 receptor-like 1 n=1 Tax=Cyprinodon variegatus TaxID=28743 RepID=UPI0007429785|nr:PREDICTED: interleukin-1 receptor-like 1 [Cyprinodon variegatus]